MFSYQRKGSLLKIYQMHNRLQQIPFLLQKMYERNNSISLLQVILETTYLSDTCYWNLLMHMLLFNSTGNLKLNGSLGLGVMLPLSIQGVIKYQIMISIAYLGFGCVRTTLSSIWILYSPLYKSPLSWTIFNSDNVHVLGTYNDGFNSYSYWLSSKFFIIVFIKKRFIIENKSNA